MSIEHVVVVNVVVDDVAVVVDVVVISLVMSW